MDSNDKRSASVLPPEAIRVVDFSRLLPGLARDTPRPAPDLGEQTEDVLAELGFSRADISRLIAERALATAAA